MDHNLDYAKFIALYCSATHFGGNNGGFGVKSYLELGVQKGYSMQLVAPYVKELYGVDVKDQRDFKTGVFFEMTTDEFFRTKVSEKERYDVIFIDACHHYANVLKDFENSLRHLSRYGTIFLHDVDPDSQEVADPKKEMCKDAYKIIYYIYQNHPELDVMVIPFTNAGLGIVRRKCDKRLGGTLNYGLI